MEQGSCFRAPVALFLVTAVLIRISGCKGECGYPAIPSGLETSAALMSLSHADGAIFTLNCTNDLQPVSYTLTCVQDEWLIESLPAGIPFQSCLSSPLEDVPVRLFHSVAEEGTSFTKVPVMYDDKESCYTSTRDEYQHWVIQMRKSIDPCFMILKLRIASFALSSSSSSTTVPVISQLPSLHFTSNQSVNCTFLRYSFIEYSPYLRAIFACEYKPDSLIRSHNFPNMMEFRNMSRFTIHFAKQSLNFTAVSFCGIAVQECTRFECGKGYPLPIGSTAYRQYAYVVPSYEADEYELSTEVIDDSDIVLSVDDGAENSTVLEDETTVMTLPNRVDKKTLRVFYKCEEGLELVSDDVYRLFGGLVCGPHGAWISSVPACRTDHAMLSHSNTGEVACFICPYFTCLLIFFVVLLTFIICTCTFNYFWIKKREERIFIRGRDSLLWVKKDLAATGRSSCFDQECPQVRVAGGTGRKMQPLDQTYSYIDIQGNLFDTSSLTEFNAATYFYLNRYESISTDQVCQHNVCATIEHKCPSDHESESDQSDKDSNSNFK